MNVLIVGGGGREHALAWKAAQSPRVARVFVAPGNAGTGAEPNVVNVPITSIPALVEFAKTQPIALTIVGPEAHLAAGIVDAFEAAGLRIIWTEPRDIDTAKQTLNVNAPGPTPEESTSVLSSYHSHGAFALYADGSVDFVSESIDPAVLKAMTTAAAGD